MSAKVYQRHARLNSTSLALTLGFMFALRFRRFFQKNAAMLYTEESRHSKPGNADKPLWSNLGYWENARNLDEACSDLARMLGNAANLQQAERQLDVGCGCAVQDILWINEFDVGSIAGLEITPLRVELARANIAAAGLEQRIDVQCGSATACDYEAQSFDSITALECAFHFRDREDFMREAFRLLRPGGRLALADILPAATPARSPIKRLLRKMGRRYMQIPDANMYAQDEYRRKLESLGFVDLRFQSIGDYVFPGVAKLLSASAAEQKPTSELSIDLQADDFVAGDWLCAWRDLAGLEDYVIISAGKPGA